VLGSRSHTIQQRTTAFVAGRAGWGAAGLGGGPLDSRPKRHWNPAQVTDSVHRAAAQVGQVVHAALLRSGPEPIPRRREEPAQQEAAPTLELLQPRLPGLGIQDLRFWVSSASRKARRTQRVMQ
jgi:hypothetical protein